MLVSSYSTQPSLWMRLSGLARLLGETSPQVDSPAPAAASAAVPDTLLARTPVAAPSDVYRAAGTPWAFQSSRFFLAQDPGPYNREASLNNTNCGPASLAMALLALGLQPPGLGTGATVENWIDATRFAMRGDTNDYELTSDDDVMQGARQSGARAWKVHDLGSLDQALDAGALVVLAGNPIAYGRRFDERSLRSFDGGHMILVAGRAGDCYVINDPYSRVGSLVVRGDELVRFMAHQGWNVGVAVSR